MNNNILRKLKYGIKNYLRYYSMDKKTITKIANIFLLFLFIVAFLHLFTKQEEALFQIANLFSMELNLSFLIRSVLICIFIVGLCIVIHLFTYSNNMSKIIFEILKVYIAGCFSLSSLFVSYIKENTLQNEAMLGEIESFILILFFIFNIFIFLFIFKIVINNLLEPKSIDIKS